jgi:hypothetical protein
LYVWAAGRPRESLYVWRITGRRFQQVVSLPFKAGFSERIKTTLLPFNNALGCLIIAPDGKSISRAPTETSLQPGQRHIDHLPNVNLPELNCARIFGDHSLIVLENYHESKREAWRHGRLSRMQLSRLVEWEIDVNGRSTVTDTPPKTLHNLDYNFPEDVDFAVSRGDNCLIIVVCSKDGNLEVVKLTKI